MHNLSFAALVPPASTAGAEPGEPGEKYADVEELDVAQLAELLVDAGLVTNEQVEALMGEDFDDDLEWWASDGDAAAAGINVPLRNVLKEQERRQSDKEYREDQDEFERTGKWPKRTHDPKDNARYKYEAIMARACEDAKHEEVSKAVGSTAARGGKYVSRHLTSGGNWAYRYSTTGQRLDNKPKTGSTGNPAGQMHTKDSSTSKNSVTQGQSFNVRFKGKTRKVKPKNQAEARAAARLLAAKKVDKED